MVPVTFSHHYLQSSPCLHGGAVNLPPIFGIPEGLEHKPASDLGLRVKGFRGLGFRGLGFRVWGYRAVSSGGWIYSRNVQASHTHSIAGREVKAISTSVHGPLAEPKHLFWGFICSIVQSPSIPLTNPYSSPL